MNIKPNEVGAFDVDLLIEQCRTRRLARESKSSKVLASHNLDLFSYVPPSPLEQALSVLKSISIS